MDIWISRPSQTHYSPTAYCGWKVLGGLWFDQGLHTCKAGTLPLEKHHLSRLLWLFWRWGLLDSLECWSGSIILQVSDLSLYRYNPSLALQLLN
jgi:hypothetical protein